MALDGVVTDEGNAAARDEMTEDETTQQATQLQAGPRGSGEQALVAGAMTVDEVAKSAKEVGDGAAAGREDGGHQEELEALGGGCGESGGQSQQQGCGFRRKGK